MGKMSRAQDNANPYDRHAITNADETVAAFIVPISPEHATVLYDKFGAYSVEADTDCGTIVIFDLQAHLEYVRQFVQKANELVEEKIDREIETGQRTTAEDDARTLSRKMGLA